MKKEELTAIVMETFGHVPTEEQSRAVSVFSCFMASRELRPAMVLCGSAGTGKTSLTAAMVKTLVGLRQRVVLLAPTGRAAKVLSMNAGIPAFTIHRRIYRQKTFTGDMTGFNLNFNKQRDTLFVVDEASMISNDSFSGGAGQFGSGCLLDDLMEYVYSGDNCRLMLVGDRAQLPPVGEDESPALMADMISGAYGLDMYSVNLNEVLRQAADSGILYNANVIRQMITHDEITQLPKICFKGFADIVMVPGDELIESLAGSYSAVGYDETMVVTRSNKRANIYNNGIRNMVLGREEELTPGDMLMVVRNNYFWTAQDSRNSQVSPQGSTDNGNPHSSGDSVQNISFIANGDRAKVRRVRNMQELYGFRFADLLLEFPDYDNYELGATVILDSLQSESPSLTHEQSEQLFNGVLADYADIPLKADRMKHVRTDKYYNALQVKFAYAVTCHKAQGGQWAHVYLDQGYMTDDMLTPDYIHWLYTAFTRATEKLFLVNWPKTQTLEQDQE
ncbi:AAA family ATPase [uncultured Prevotella sp.]|uniref:ATP-dependent DNA helicase n=1 Tax=uncultured Prevotella sp. TaxID=159272 RepID=UPI002615847B|nr:AAA family ATPase [uncultured Prevotella sp.]